MIDIDILNAITIQAVPVLLAITVHEVAHGWVALKLGDHTARIQGRISMNPIRHIDPVGTVLLPILQLIFIQHIYFGYAKPVPVDPGNFKKPREHMAIVALAGPVSNLIMAVMWALLFSLAVHGLSGTWIGYPLSLMAQTGIVINLVLMLLNLIPLPPLDGGRVLMGVLQPALALKYARIEPYGIVILLLLIFSDVLAKVMLPIIRILAGILTKLVGV
jgi:Zn-dependent protease